MSVFLSLSSGYSNIGDAGLLVKRHHDIPLQAHREVAAVMEPNRQVSVNECFKEDPAVNGTYQTIIPGIIETVAGISKFVSIAKGTRHLRKGDTENGLLSRDYGQRLIRLANDQSNVPGQWCSSY